MAKYEIIGYDREKGDKRVRVYESQNEENAILQAAEDGIVVDKCKITILQAEVPAGTPIQFSMPQYQAAPPPVNVQTNVHVTLPTTKKRGALAGASLVFALLAMLGCWIPFVGVFSAILAVIGLVLGILALLVSFFTRTKIRSALAGILFSALALGIAIYVTGSAAREIESTPPIEQAVPAE